MLKKLSLVGIVLAASSGLAMADSTYHKKHHMKHVDENYKAEASYKGEATCPPPPVYFSNGAYLGLSLGERINYSSRPAVYNGLEGNLSLGYAYVMERYYLAGEIYVGDSIALQNYTNNGSVRSTWSYGLSILPGMLINDTVLGYLRLGVLRTNFSSNNNSATGGQIGLGLQTALSQAWDLRGEYIYNMYNSVSHAGSVKAAQFNLGLLYKLNWM